MSNSDDSDETNSYDCFTVRICVSVTGQEQILTELKSSCLWPVVRSPFSLNGG